MRRSAKKMQVVESIEDQKTEGTKRKDKEKNLETRERERRPRQRRKAMLRHGAFSIEMTEQAGYSVKPCSDIWRCHAAPRVQNSSSDNHSTFTVSWHWPGTLHMLRHGAFFTKMT